MYAELAVTHRAQPLEPFAHDGVQPAARAGSFSSFGGGSSSRLQLAARAGSLSSLGGKSSGSLSALGSTRVGSGSPVGKGRSRQALLDVMDAELPGVGPGEVGAAAAAVLGDQLQRVQLAS